MRRRILIAKDLHLFPFFFFGCRYAITKAFLVAFAMTFFSAFDVPVFWPILLCYWMVLFFLTMKRQILHMIKYKYIPFNVGKQVISYLFNPLVFFLSSARLSPSLCETVKHRT